MKILLSENEYKFLKSVGFKGPREIDVEMTKTSKGDGMKPVSSSFGGQITPQGAKVGGFVKVAPVSESEVI